MIYVYRCDGCEKTYDIIKSVSEFEKEELCPVSHITMTREFSPRKIHLFRTAVEEKEWQPAFGKAMTRREMEREARQRSWTQVGNEDLSKHVQPERTEYPDFSEEDLRSLTPEKLQELP